MYKKAESRHYHQSKPANCFILHFTGYKNNNFNFMFSIMMKYKQAFRIPKALLEVVFQFSLLQLHEYNTWIFPWNGMFLPMWRITRNLLNQFGWSWECLAQVRKQQHHTWIYIYTLSLIVILAHSLLFVGKKCLWNLKCWIFFIWIWKKSSEKYLSCCNCQMTSTRLASRVT